MERRATAGNAATAAAYAAQVQRQFQDRIAIADDLLVLLANGTRLSGWADEQRLVNPFCRVSFLDSHDVAIAALPLATCAPLPSGVTAIGQGDGTFVTRPVVAKGAATFGVRIALNGVERAAVDPAGHIRSIQVQFPVAGLITRVNAEASGSYTIVDTDTAVVLASANAKLTGVRVGSAAARRALLTKRPASMLTYAPHLHHKVLTSYQPISLNPALPATSSLSVVPMLVVGAVRLKYTALSIVAA